MNKEFILLMSIYAVACVLTFIMDSRIPFVINVSKSIDESLDKDIIPDVLTGWQVTHLGTRFLCGFVAPSYWKINVCGRFNMGV